MTILPRCARIDLLSRELIEAYRRVDDKDLFCISDDGDPGEIASLHHQMTAHRNSCESCKRILRLAMNRSVEHKSASIIEKPGIRPHPSQHQSR